MATSTFYPGGGPITATYYPASGTTVRQGAFSYLRTFSTGTFEPGSSSSNPVGFTTEEDGVWVTKASLSRIALEFNTAAIPSDAVVQFVRLRVRPVSHSAGHTLSVVSLTPDSQFGFGDGDFDSFTMGSVLGSRTFPVGAVNNIFDISLPIGALVKGPGARTYLGLVSEGDRANVWINAHLSTLWMSTSMSLEVMWRPAPQGVTPSLLGQGGGVLAPDASEAVSVELPLLGQDGGVLAPSVGNLGGDAVLGEVLGSPSGVLPPALSVGGVSTMRPNLLGTPGEVVSPTVGIRPRLLGPFSVLLDAPLRQGDRVTLTALLRRTGDEPIPLHEALGVELHATSQAGDPISDWGDCTIEHPGDARVTYVFQVDDLVGVTSLDIVFRVRWRGGQTLVPTAPLTLAVT